MANWAKNASQYKIKVSYRAGKTRATIALPSPILQHIDHPEYVLFEVENDRVVMTPVSDMNNSNQNSRLIHLFKL